jgi:DNA-binding CsgD family transcriptional regulator
VTSAEELNVLIEAIHDAGLDARQWPQVLRTLAERMGAQDATLSVGRVGEQWSLDDWSGIEAPFVRSYNEYYGSLDPVIPLIASARPGTIVTDTTLIPPPRESSEFFQDWVRPQHMCGVAIANVLCEDGAVVLLGATRTRAAPYRQEEVDLLAALLPHIRHAVRTQRHLEGASLKEQVQGEALDAFVHAIVIVDKEARVMVANRAGQQLLTDGDTLRAGRQGLMGPTPGSSTVLRGLIQKATSDDAAVRSGGAMLMQRPAPAEPLQVLVSPLDPEGHASALNPRGRAAMLLIIDSQYARHGLGTRLTALFGLTPAEARVACEVGKGENPNDVADRLGVMPSTVRTHLHHVFAKTATRRQAELMRLIAQLAVARID